MPQWKTRIPEGKRGFFKTTVFMMCLFHGFARANPAVNLPIVLNPG